MKPAYLPLSDVRVVAIETGAAGPFASRLLADLGADVVKIEPPGVGDVSRTWDTVCDGLSSATIWLNRNKRSVALDLKTEQGREALLKLAATADVVTENFKPGAVDKLGVGYEAVRAVQPKIIYGHISGFGRTGPYRDEKAYDMIIQGESGLLSLTGSPEAPAKVPISICDLSAGMYAALTVVALLHRRSTSGTGGEFDVSMLESILSLYGTFPHMYWHDGISPPRTGARHHMLSPYGPYEDIDGKQFSIAVLSPSSFAAFCRSVIERPELIEDERFRTNELRVRNRQMLEATVAEIFGKKTREIWLDRLRGVGIPCGIVNDLGEALAHPQLAYLEAIKEVKTSAGPMRELVSPIRIDGGTLPLGHVPDHGEHTNDVLATLKERT
jgi:itaconate CoA-transferase